MSPASILRLWIGAPFWVVTFLLLFSTSSAGQSTYVASPPFKMILNLDWKPLSVPAREALRTQVEKEINKQSKRFYGIDDSHPISLPHLVAFQTSDAELNAIIHVMRIPPQPDYLQSINRDFEAKLQWGRQQGFVEECKITHQGRIGKLLSMAMDCKANDKLFLWGMLFDELMPYQVVQVVVSASPKHAADARRGFDQILRTLTVDFTVTGTVGKEPFVISNRCQEYWIVARSPGPSSGEVVLVLQEPHWDYVGHWNLHQGLRVFFEENPKLVKKSVFLAEGWRFLEELSLGPLFQAGRNPDDELVRTVLLSYLATGYVTYAWASEVGIPILGTEEWVLYQESVRHWIADEIAPWAVTVAARNQKLVEALTTTREHFANPMLFVGGMHLHGIDTDLYSKGRAALPADSPSRARENEGIIGALRRQKVELIYIEPVPSTRSDQMPYGIEMERYRKLFQAQLNGDYHSYISDSVQAIRDLDLFGRLPKDGVTVSPSPEAAAILVSHLKQEQARDGDDTNKNNDEVTPPESRDADHVKTTITLSEIMNKTREFLRNLAREKGLIPDPKNDSANLEKSERFYDALTGKQRLRIDPGHKTKSGVPYDNPNARAPHVHAYEADGKSYIRDKEGEHHFPLLP